MSGAPELVPAHLIDWKAVLAVAQADVITVLENSREFTEAQTLQAQCYHACQSPHETHRPVVPYSMIGRIFQIDKSAASYHARRYLSHADKAGLQGRPPILEATRVDEVIAKILEAYARGVPWAVGDVARSILTQWNLSIERNTLRHLLKRDGRTKSCNGIPMEQNRLELASEQVHAHILRLIETMDGIHGPFRFSHGRNGS
jgi:hypothetical protein